MQPASDMCGLPQAENIIRRLSERGVPLRNGQADLLRAIASSPGKKQYIGVLPTGYGKSISTLISYELLRELGRVDRMMIIVPTDTQRGQYISDVADDCAKCGMELSGVEKVDGSTRNLRKHKNNIAEIYVTTAQFLMCNEGHFADLMEKGHWFVVADEFQKLREEGEWGKSVRDLNGEAVLGVTATPIRTDGVPTILGGVNPDVEVTLSEAYEERAIRGVRAHLEHYFVDVKNTETNEVDRVTTEDLRNVSNWEGYKQKRDLRELNKYISSMLGSAYECWLSKSARHPGEHRILVFAMSVSHARMVSDTISILYGEGFSDWIGVGPFGRSDAENADVLKRFKAGELECLVQVDKAGEGFNCKQASTLVFLNILGKNTVKARQYMGRGLRRNPAIGEFEDDICDVFVSPDTDLAELAAEYAERTVGAIEPGDEGDDDRSGPEGEGDIYLPPDPLPWESFVKNAEFDRSELISKIPDHEVREVAGRLEKRGTPATDDQIRDVIFDIKREQMAAAQQAKETPEEWGRRVDLLVKSAASLAVRLTNKGVIQPNVLGDAIRAIHRKWIKTTGQRTSSMLESEFRDKYDWVSGLITDMKENREAPIWLRL